jgi:esterase/lipase superfamily enzyme
MGTRVPGHHHVWHSPSVGRQMHVRWFGHAGARLLAFPTTMGDHNEWPNRYMPDVLRDHIQNGWLQLWCVDTNHDASWYNKSVHPGERAWRHLAFDHYLLHELLPFTEHVNRNPFVIATGASFGAYHAMCFALRHPHRVHRVIAMSGMFDIRGMTEGYSDPNVYVVNPFDFIQHEWEHHRLEAFRRQDLIIATGRGDPNFAENAEFSAVLWNKGIGNALRIWDGWSHDWPYWEKMIRMYVGGHD